jgi:hypothetical protein
MAAKKFLRQNAGVLTEALGVQASAGVANAGDIVALDDTGKIDATLMPTGIGAETSLVVASEALSAGNWVNVYDLAGSPRVRKADATAAGKPCNGFVLAAVASGGNATVYTDGINNQVTGQTAGEVFLQTTPGLGGPAAPSTGGNVLQSIGTAVSATSVVFDFDRPITLV